MLVPGMAEMSGYGHHLSGDPLCQEVRKLRKSVCVESF